MELKENGTEANQWDRVYGFVNSEGKFTRYYEYVSLTTFDGASCEAYDAKVTYNGVWVIVNGFGKGCRPLESKCFALCSFEIQYSEYRTYQNLPRS